VCSAHVKRGLQEFISRIEFNISGEVRCSGPLCPAAARDDSIAMFRKFALEISVETALTLRLLRRQLEFALYELFDALIACQTQADQRAFVFQVDVKIKKRTAFVFCNGPIG